MCAHPQVKTSRRVTYCATRVCGCSSTKFLQYLANSMATTLGWYNHTGGSRGHDHDVAAIDTWAVEVLAVELDMVLITERCSHPLHPPAHTRSPSHHHPYVTL